MAKYRVDFYRSSNDQNEIKRSNQSKALILSFAKEIKDSTRAYNTLKEHFNQYPENMILDSAVIEAPSGMIGPELIEQYIQPKYPDAKLSTYDEIR